jgi:hypothetical protein
MDKMSDYKTTPKEEAQAIVEQELTTAEEKLKEMNVPTTAENLLLMFSNGIQEMLTRHLTNMRTILDGVEKREIELLYWIGEVKKMMDAVIEYRDSLNLQHDIFIEDAKALFESKVQSLTKINYN